jgi:hypothetical protein
MKRSMKKFMVACAAVSAMTVAAGMSAMAATYDEATNTATYALPDAAENTQMTVLVIPKDAQGNVGDEDILYINQDAQGGTGVDGTAELKGTKLDDGTYLVMVGYYVDSDNFKIAEDTFTVGDAKEKRTVMVGDANLSNTITAADATLILKHTGKVQTLEGDALIAAARSNGNDSVTTADATAVVKYAAKVSVDYVGTVYEIPEN